MKTIRDTEIKLIKGDITKLRVDAIVNSTTTYLWMIRGVGEAIKRAGGRCIEEELARHRPIKAGSVVTTQGGNLRAKWVIHVATIGDDLRTDLDIIRLATQNCLKKADELGIESIAFPALGTGIGKLPEGDVADAMLTTIYEYIKGGTSIRSITLSLFSTPCFEVFLKRLNSLNRRPS